MQEIIKMGTFNDRPIEWIILKRWERERKALVISKDAVYMGAFDEKSLLSWAESGIRPIFNIDFLENCFTEEEQSRIIPKKLSREKSDLIESDVLDTYDRIFFLSIQEAERFFSNDDKRKTHCLNEPNEKQYVAWWLRSRIAGENTISCVELTGRINRIGRYPNDDEVGFRPALYINLDV